MRFDGASWTEVGGGIPTSFLYELLGWDDGTGPALYAVGRFSTAGAASAENVARWDGLAWSALGGGITSSGGITVAALEAYDDGTGEKLYVGGRFDSAGGVPVSHLASWDGASWADVGGGVGALNDDVHDLLAVDLPSVGGSVLVVAGEFAQVGGVGGFNSVATWNGTSWGKLRGLTQGGVWDLAVFDDGDGPFLYSAGVGHLFNGPDIGNVARWTGTAWVGLGERDGRTLRTIDAFGEDPLLPALWVGGTQETAGASVGSHNVSRWIRSLRRVMPRAGGPVDAR